MDREALSGVFAPIVTPFFENEEIDFDALRYNVECYNRTALRGYMPLGSNGEFQGLTDEEAVRVLRCVNRSKAAGKLVVVGCGRESAYKTVEFIKRVADEGVDMAFVLSPHYFVGMMTDERLLAYYRRVADESPAPIVVYNAPKFSAGLTVSTDLLRELAAHPNIIAMKNSSTYPNTEYVETLKYAGGMQLITGNIATFYSGLCAGAVAGVLSTASYMPEYCCALFDHFAANRREEAQKLSDWLQALSANTAGPLGVAGVKCCMELRGMRGGALRLPLTRVTPEERARIAAYFERERIGPVSH